MAPGTPTPAAGSAIQSAARKSLVHKTISSPGEMPGEAHANRAHSGRGAREQSRSRAHFVGMPMEPRTAARPCDPAPSASVARRYLVAREAHAMRVRARSGSILPATSHCAPLGYEAMSTPADADNVLGHERRPVYTPVRVAGVSGERDVSRDRFAAASADQVELERPPSAPFAHPPRVREVHPQTRPEAGLGFREHVSKRHARVRDQVRDGGAGAGATHEAARLPGRE